jgi:hypothetical protein
MLADLGGAASVAMVRMGDALGLYKTLHDELASAANVNPRYLREWLAHQAASVPQRAPRCRDAVQWS